MGAGHRQCVLLEGTPDTTSAHASASLSALRPDQVLWVGGEAPPKVTQVEPAEVKRHLGASFDAVVLDLHRALDPDLVGQCHGFVWGGGALILRLPPPGMPPLEGRRRLAVHPYDEDAVSHRFFSRFLTAIKRSGCLVPRAKPQGTRAVDGTADQERVVAELTALFESDVPEVAVLLSDRGRGKSSALGIALRGIRDTRSDAIAVTAAQSASAAEVFRFANANTETSPIPYVDPVELANTESQYEIIVVDEAAQLSVSLLQSIVARHPAARIAFASTARGYEGTGRGFALRFLEWLRNQGRPVRELSLQQPIRWASDDPLEAAIYDALLLDAQAAPAPMSLSMADVDHVVLDRDALVHDEARLRDYFGLLVHAHYRTSPSDLHRILDAPNLRLHALIHRNRVVAATLVALEGQLDEALCGRVFWGYERLRGNALPETLISHSGQPASGRLKMVRSIRIAVHPSLRRQGLASKLVEAIHQSYSPDLFGTLFGVTPELLSFRRSVGYELVRLGASRGSRTGEPTAVMLNAVSTAAQRLMDRLRGDLARDLPAQLDLQRADAPLPLDPRLIEGVLSGLPEPTPLSSDATIRSVAAFAFGPRTLESVISALRRFVTRHQASLSDLATQEESLIRGRILEGHAWSVVTVRAGFATIPAAMRATRRALRALVMAVDPEIASLKPPRDSAP